MRYLKAYCLGVPRRGLPLRLGPDASNKKEGIKSSSSDAADFGFAPEAGFDVADVDGLALVLTVTGATGLGAVDGLCTLQHHIRRGPYRHTPLTVLLERELHR